jgi:hypothetical protein
MDLSVEESEEITEAAHAAVFILKLTLTNM